MGGVEQAGTSAVGSGSGHCVFVSASGAKLGIFSGRPSEREKERAPLRRRLGVTLVCWAAENLSSWIFCNAWSKDLAGLCHCCCSRHGDGRSLAGLTPRLGSNCPRARVVWFTRLSLRARRLRRPPNRTGGYTCVEESLLKRYHHKTAATRRFEGRVMSITGEGCIKADF